MMASLTAMTLSLAACGGKSAAEKSKEAAASSGSGRGTITCDGSATKEATGLPSGFPQPDAVTYVSVKKTGPTVVVDGYSTESLEGMYNEYKDRVNEAARAGLNRAVDEGEQAGAFNSVEAFLLHAAIGLAPIDKLISYVRQYLS